jgi:hypothetical protein
MAAGDVSVSITSNNGKRAAIFDGTNDYAEVADPADGSLDFGTGDFSFGGWVRLETQNSAAARYIIAKGSAGNVGYATQVSTNGTIRTLIQSASGSNNVAGIQIIEQTWTHFMVVHDRDDKIYIYLNNVLVNSEAYAAGVDETIDNTQSFTIGAYASTINWSAVSMHDIQVHNKALTAAERTDIYRGKIIPSCVSRWAFEKNDYTDSVGSNDLTNSGSYIQGIDSSISLAIRAQRVTANDNWFATGLVGGQLVVVGVEET